MTTVTPGTCAAQHATVSLTTAIHKLAEIGVHSEHGIRDHLQQEGVTGVPGESSGCPIANWMIKVTGATTARVDTYSIDLVYEVSDGPAIKVSEFTPAVIAEHIDRFDFGAYPELIA